MWSPHLFRSLGGQLGHAPSRYSSAPVRTTDRSAPAVYFSRDHGATWDYALAGPYNTAGLRDERTFWINANNEVLIYRKDGLGQAANSRTSR